MQIVAKFNQRRIWCNIFENNKNEITFNIQKNFYINRNRLLREEKCVETISKIYWNDSQIFKIVDKRKLIWMWIIRMPSE